MLIGYARVSSIQQNEDRQLIALKNFGVDEKNIYIDKQSGKNFERVNYKKMYAKLKKGDILVIKSIDRLGRNYKEILEQWQLITKKRCADIVVLDMALFDTRKHKDLLQLLSCVAENERLSIKKWQAERIKAVKERGVNFGKWTD